LAEQQVLWRLIYLELDPIDWVSADGKLVLVGVIGLAFLGVICVGNCLFFCTVLLVFVVCRLFPNCLFFGLCGLLLLRCVLIFYVEVGGGLLLALVV
jgi:hypothetical protein